MILAGLFVSDFRGRFVNTLVDREYEAGRREGIVNVMKDEE